jgi:hypothetical protein
MFLIVMCLPRAQGRSDDDGIDIGTHRVFDIGGNQDETPDWIRLWEWCSQ